VEAKTKVAIKHICPAAYSSKTGYMLLHWLQQQKEKIVGLTG
jgi:hypothetical protein